MPFNGSGGFTRTQDWTNDAAANIKILADRHDNNDDDIANGLSSVICKDGQTTITADIPWNGHKLTSIGDPVAAQDAATKAYVDDAFTASIKTMTSRLVSTSETYTKPAGLKYLRVSGVGPGGGGGTAPLTTSGFSAGSGGGAGGSGVRMWAAADLPATISIAIASPGGNTTFGALATLNGGNGGSPLGPSAGIAAIAGALGGSASGWTVNGVGAPGGPAWVQLAGAQVRGEGGSTAWGGGGREGISISASGFLAGENATGFGAGGAGAVNNNNQPAHAGGTGAPSFLLLEEFF